MKSLYQYLKENQNDFGPLYAEIIKLHIDPYDFTKDAEHSRILEGYCSVISRILKFEPVTSKFPPYVTVVPACKEDYVEEAYVDVCILNPDYKGPAPAGLKCWGCSEGETPPEGYYDVNCTDYYKTLGIGGTAWKDIVFAEVVLDDTAKELGEHEVMANVLWEMTFYGYEEEKITEFFDEINRRKDKYYDMVDLEKLTEDDGGGSYWDELMKKSDRNPETT